MSTQNSILHYVPQPYHDSGAATLAASASISSIENSSGIFDPDLSNYATVVPTASVNSFAVQMTFTKTSAWLAAADMTVALIGCSLLTYEDIGGSPDYNSEFSEDINCLLTCTNIGAVTTQQQSYAHNSQDSIHKYSRVAMPSVISGGRANVIFTGLGKSSSNTAATIVATFERVAANVTARPHARLNLGHLFIGVDLPIVIDPNSFTWTLKVENERFKARDFGAISSDGTLVKYSSGEVIKIGHNDLIGSLVTSLSPEVATVTPNFFDLVKVNTSYPILFNPYPEPTVAASTLTLDEANLTARQNWFSIYGFMDDPLELLVSNYRNSLDSEYRARYRIIETR